MIKTFEGAATERLFNGDAVKAFVGIRKTALRKLDMLAAARTLADLRSPPGNHLEELKGDRRGQRSIRINDQFRICFVWDGDGARDVEIVDYH